MIVTASSMGTPFPITLLHVRPVHEVEYQRALRIPKLTWSIGKKNVVWKSCRNNSAPQIYATEGCVKVVAIVPTGPKLSALPRKDEELAES